MKNTIIEAMKKLNQELVNRCIVYDAPDIPDQYNQCASLDGVYDWGFTVVTYCDVLDPIMTFYDWEFQSIVSIDLDDETQYHLRHGMLSVKQSYMFSDTVQKFVVNLTRGAAVHEKDIQAIGYMPNLGFSDDKRFYALKDGRIYYKKDGESLRLLKATTVADLTRQGFEIIQPENYGANINILNDMICRM